MRLVAPGARPSAQPRKRWRRIDLLPETSLLTEYGGSAVLIGAEVNFAIESTDRHQAEFSKKKRALEQALEQQNAA